MATSDDHFVVIDGRRWRATDPSIPDTFRTELVRELMDARRAIGAANRAGADPSSDRERVQDAKLALGERGEPWWEQPTEDGFHRRIDATTRALLRSRAPASSICPSDVARTIGGPRWRTALDEVRMVAARAQQAGEIRVTQGEHDVTIGATRGPIRLRRGWNFPDPPRSSPGAGGR
jgi:hypothetical protein